MTREQVSFQQLHTQLLQLVEIQKKFADDPFKTEFDDGGYGWSTVREPQYTELMSATKAYLHAVEVHRLLFDEEYREKEIDRLADEHEDAYTTSITPQ